MDTDYASPERSNDIEIVKQTKLIQKSNLLSEIIHVATDIALILNKDRQIVFANESLFNFLGIDTELNIIGLRPGELFGCIHATDNENGCGTSEACRYCGAVNTVLKSRKVKYKVNSEVRLTVGEKQNLRSFDLNISAISVNFEGEIFTLLSITDISNRIRRELIEKVFYHDVINKISGITGLIDLIKSESINNDSVKVSTDIITLLDENASELFEQILSQRDLYLAENGKLQLKVSKINSIDFLNKRIKAYMTNDITSGKSIKLKEDSKDFDFYTDKIILGRIFENLLKNAIEAVSKGMEILVYCSESEETVNFCVYNETIMSEEVKLQIFQRSFSTKGVNRGLGTYSIKLFTEQYLKGEITFVSEEDKGTTFCLRLPRVLEAN